MLRGPETFCKRDRKRERERVRGKKRTSYALIRIKITMAYILFASLSSERFRFLRRRLFSYLRLFYPRPECATEELRNQRERDRVQTRFFFPIFFNTPVLGQGNRSRTGKRSRSSLLFLFLVLFLSTTTLFLQPPG